jgi:hypothetical protein
LSRERGQSLPVAWSRDKKLGNDCLDCPISRL